MRGGNVWIESLVDKMRSGLDTVGRMTGLVGHDPIILKGGWCGPIRWAAGSDDDGGGNYCRVWKLI